MPTDAVFHLYLASKSPRRRELLEQLGLGYRLVEAEVDETPHPGEVPEVYVLRLALAKARAGLAALSAGDRRPVLGADTSVVVDGEILGKPRDRDDAMTMLGRLSGRRHQVVSGVALVDAEGYAGSRLSVSHVGFRELATEECARYWASGEPADKAGAYGIQGLGAVFIDHLDGSYSGVMGLPVFETAELLAEVGIRLPLENIA